MTFMVPAKWADKRHDGQVLRHDMHIERASIMRLVEKPPEPFSVDRLFDRPVLSPRSAMADLGLDQGTLNSWVTFLNDVVYGSTYEMSVRQQVMERLKHEAWDNSLRRVVMHRAIQLYKDTAKKSIVTVDELRKALFTKAGLELKGRIQRLCKRKGITRAEFNRRAEARRMNKAQGEGTRGGKVIGHTPGGKPIYQSSKKEAGTERATRDALRRFKSIAKDPNPEDMRSLMIAVVAAVKEKPEAKGDFHSIMGDLGKMPMSPASAKMVQKVSKLIGVPEHDPTKTPQWMKPQRDPTKTPDWMRAKKSMRKAEGGLYHRRIPNKGGKGYRYFYTEKDYNSSKDSHQSGDDMRKYAMGRDLIRAIEDAGSGGCDIKGMKRLAKKYGRAELGDELKKQCANGKMIYKGKRFYAGKSGQMS